MKEWQWAWTTDPTVTRSEAIKLLEERLAIP